MERLSTPSPELEPGPARSTDAARRLTGIDASRSGLGGYRWQLELCLLAARTPRRQAVRAGSRRRSGHRPPTGTDRALPSTPAKPLARAEAGADAARGVGHRPARRSRARPTAPNP